MEKRQIGTSGLQVSVLGLGCNNFGGRTDKAGSVEVIHRALDLSIDHFDTAELYPMGNSGASEECLGEALGPRRKDVVLVTKFGYEPGIAGGSRRYMMAALERSLARLKTDWIDLYLLHRPDPLTPIDETLRALDDVVRQGKVRYIGCSNFAAWQDVEAALIAKELGTERFICAQDEYSLLVRDVEREVVPAAAKYGIGIVPFFPLASGLLTGKYKAGAPGPEGARLTTAKPLADRFMTPRNMALVEKYTAFAEARGKTLLDLAFAWLLAQPTVPSVIAGATRPGQLDANAAAVDWKLTAEDLAEIDRLTDE